MNSRLARCALLAVAVLLAACPPLAATAATAPTAPAAGTTATNWTPERAAEITAVYPNPVADGDRGEYVVVRFPNRTDLTGWHLNDGESTVSLPNVTASGAVALSTAPATARNLTDRRVLALSGSLSLANSGETLTLRREAVVDSATYEDAPEGERWTRRASSWQWIPLGATDRPTVRTNASDARAFVLPDAPAVPLSAIRAADERVLLAGYTFSSRRVAGALRNAAARGVRVRVLVDDGPVGGMTGRQAAVLDRLAASDVAVEVIGGARGRYAFHHPKYAVADDRALVMTENWKPAGTGGNGSRGWGVLVESTETAAELAAVFRADADWKDTTPWAQFRANESFEPATPANETYPTRFPARTLPVDSVEVATAPENAERRVVDLLASANDSLRVQQVSIGGRNQPFLRETLDAARRGVRVRVLLSSAWYVREDNRKLVTWLNDRASEEGLSLSARLAEPRSRYGKIHAKGVVVDGETAVVGSLNWNNHSARENREVALLVHGDAAAAYYGRVFRADWRGGAWRLPVWFGAAAVLGVASAGIVGKRAVKFADGSAAGQSSV